MAAGRIGDVEDRLVGREGEAVGLGEIVGDDADLAALRIDPVDVAAGLLHLGLVALVVAHDPVVRIGEPDRAVRLDHHVVGRIEPLALVGVGDDRDRAVGFGAGDAARAVLAGDQPPLAVARVAVGVVGVGAEDVDAAVPGPAHHAVVGDVAPDQLVGVGEPDRPLRPAAFVVEQLDLRRAVDEEGEALVVMFGDFGDQRHEVSPGVCSWDWSRRRTALRKDQPMTPLVRMRLP